MNAKKAFTLIELLVVIAIIAILAAILFPVFAQAKAAAKKTAALSSVKQTSLACLMYSGDSNDQFPIGVGYDWITAEDGGWAWDTQPYIKSLPLLQDPSDPKTKFYWEDWFKTPPTPAVPISFAANGLIQTWNNVQSGVMHLCQGKDMNGTISRNNPTGITGGWMDGSCTTSQTSISRVADTIMLASHYNGNNYFGPGSSVITGKPWWDGTGAGASPDPTRDGTPYTITKNGAIDTVNKDNRNGAVAVYGTQGLFAFADGHAKAMDPKATVPPAGIKDDPMIDDSKDLWNARRP